MQIALWFLLLGCSAEPVTRYGRPARRPLVAPGAGGGDSAAPADTAGGQPGDSGGDTAEDTAADTGEAETGEPGDTAGPGAAEVCYLGPDRDGAVCFPLVPYDEGWGEDYDYPEPYGGSAQYAAPARYVDLDAADASTALAPNFVLEEFMAAWKGRWGVMQPHAVARAQALRDELGAPLPVNSAYRSPAYNASVGGVSSSRHQYGDAVDLDVAGMSADELADLCAAHGADYVATYDTGHTHCDWRDEPLDPAFYDVMDGPPAPRRPRPAHSATILRDGAGWTAPALGFDEGEPTRRWSAFDGEGDLLATGAGPRFRPPAGARRVRVEVGRQVEVEVRLAPDGSLLPLRPAGPIPVPIGL